MRMKWAVPGTDDPVIIPASSWSPTNVLVSYWESSTDCQGLPEKGLRSLGDPYATEYVPTVDFDAGEGEFLGSGRSENVFARFEGFINFEVYGFYELCIHSDDASVLYFDDEKIVKCCFG